MQQHFYFSAEVLTRRFTIQGVTVFNDVVQYYTKCHAIRKKFQKYFLSTFYLDCN